MTAKVRPFRRTDKQFCLRIFDSNVPDYFDSTERDDFGGFLDDPSGRYFVAEQQEKIVGCGGFAREDRGQARFTWGMVDRKYHKTGLGRLLAEHRLQAIIEDSCFKEVELFTTPKVAPFFERFGFVATYIETDGFAPGMDKVQMIKNLMGGGHG